MAQMLLSTKLFIPQMADNLIIRSTQLEKLRRGYQGMHQLALICAPAGYGKTTLVLEFLQTVSNKAAWVSLDEGDNDTQRFLAYFAAALKNAGVIIGSDVASVLTDLSFGTVETVGTVLINCISEHEDKLIVVLDDYHTIHSPKINEILKFLLEHQPPNLYIMIISREDPQLPLARLRMKGKLTEIRLNELVFNKNEAVEFFRKVTGTYFNENTIDKMNDRTEGWIAGLQLTALLLNNVSEEHYEDVIHKFDGSNNYIIDYLVEEVLGQLEPEIQDFLCKTSILDRMNVALCNEITGRQDSMEVLNFLGKKNLFLIALDEKKEWHRYHHLFADSLKTCLTLDEERNLYQKAASWMKNNGYSQEAVRYSLKSKDIALTVALVEDSILELFQTAQLETMVEWLKHIPDEYVKRSEALCIRKGIALYIIGKGKEAAQYLEGMPEEYVNKLSSHNHGLFLLLKAMLANIQGEDAEPLAEEALSYLEPWDPISRTSALNTLGRAQYQKGKLSKALLTFEKAYIEGLTLGLQFITTLVLTNYCACLLVMDQAEKAIGMCDQYIDQMRCYYEKLPPYIGILYLTMAELYGKLEMPDKESSFRELGLTLCKSISFDGEGTLRIYKQLKAGSSDVKISKNMDSVLESGEKLSEREIEILVLLAKGLSNREIADTLFITINTTQWHLSHIYAKLGVKNRTHAILKAKELNIAIP